MCWEEGGAGGEQPRRWRRVLPLGSFGWQEPDSLLRDGRSARLDPLGGTIESMADPLLTDIFKVQAVFRDDSNLPENQFINNWYFRNDEIAVTPFNAIKAVLDAFYFQPAANGFIIKAQMASHVLTAAEYRIYDLGQPPPRTRNTVVTAGSSSSQGAGLPGEVAVCSSFYSGQNVKRKRGRHYIGPLGAGASDGAGSPRPSPELRAAIIDRAKNVANSTENVTWVVVSQVGVMANEVTGGWCDNAFDTQRRRGNAPSGRVVWLQ